MTTSGNPPRFRSRRMRSALPGSLPASPSLSVLLVNWNGKAHLRACLASLAEQTDRDFDVLVVDNGSTDGSVELLAQEFPSVQVLQTGANLGFAEACNQGLSRLETAWVFFLNNDTRVAPSAIAALRRCAAESPADVGMIQARLLFFDRPHLTNSTGVLVQANGTVIDRDFAKPRRPDDQREEIFCSTAGAALYRRSMLDKLRLPTGVLDRSFFMYYEDVDLGWRARLAGHRALYLPEAEVLHHFQGSAPLQTRAFVASQCAANKLRLLLKNASWSYVARASPGVLWRDLLPLFRHRGLAAVPLLAAAVRDGLSQRAHIERLLDAQITRQGLEARWFR